MNAIKTKPADEWTGKASDVPARPLPSVPRFLEETDAFAEYGDENTPTLEPRVDFAEAGLYAEHGGKRILGLNSFAAFRNRRRRSKDKPSSRPMKSPIGRQAWNFPCQNYRGVAVW
jgi:hypothetical protein